MRQLVLGNARIVCLDEIVHGTLVVGADGLIESLSSSPTAVPDAVDCEGDYLVPGLVELHTDNLERYFTPRPGVDWPGRSAVVTHDAQIVAAGITSVFDALALGDVVHGSDRLRNLRLMIDALHDAEVEQIHRADHFLHLRCEVSFAGAFTLFESLVDHPLVRLVSVMDHSPGQRQFAREDKYREYYQGKYGFSDAQLDAFIARQIDASARYAEPYRTAIVAACRQRGIPVASHDDATLEHVAESSRHGMLVAEFPTTLEAARASHEAGLSVLMGAPNIVRGGSHSGNVAAAELARQGYLDILSSDYYPSSLLDAAFRLAALDNDYDLPAAIRTVSHTPARCAGLGDRGLISPGKRADLVRVRAKGSCPLIRQVWKRGERVF